MHIANDWLDPASPLPQLKVGEVLPPRIRKPQFPLKDRRTLFSDEEIEQARDNIKRYPTAAKLAEQIVQAADYWVAWDDGALRDLMASAEVPRAFDCSPEGCPKCGKKIFEVAKSTYPWIIAPEKPFKVQCPICESFFPSNDYGKFYRSGFTDRSDFEGPYVDDGRGWLSPEGGRYWFVAHANHWTSYWHAQAGNPSFIKAGEVLGRAYLLTGDQRYAHKAAVILHRVAEVYPNMDHATQSRNGELLASLHNERYSGKIVNAIWESALSAQFAETYDAVWETIDGDAKLHAFTGKSGEEIRAFIEANLLEEIIDAYYEVKTRGNYGMHQRSLMQTAVVRQQGDNARYVADVVDKPDGAIFLGLRYALYSLVWRDGHPYEVGGYNFTWVSNIVKTLGLLTKLGVDLGQLPRIQRILDAPMDSILIGAHTPAMGDTQTVYGGIVGEDAEIYQTAFRLLGYSRYARFLASFGATGEDTFQSFASLLFPPVKMPVEEMEAGRGHIRRRSRLLSGFGLSLLNNPADTVGLSLYHGLHVNHRHFDRLHFDVFANGQAMMPDLGYPDAMNMMVSGIFTWSLSTISHNTVTVDEVMQPGNAPGVVELQVEGDWARAISVNAPDTYPQCPVYRRTQVMVDVDPEQSYLVDFFELEGGRQHDYSLHGPPGDFAISGGKWSDPAPGTLAGEGISLGEIYDDPVLGASGYEEGYRSYRGSGFQHLEAVRHHLGGEWVAEYSHERDAHARLRLRVMPQDGQQLMQAEARVSPVKCPQKLRYFIARREGDAEQLASKFASVIEPYAEVPFLKSAHRVDLETGTAIVISRVDRGIDVVLHGAPNVAKEFTYAGHELRTDARIAIFGFDAAGALERLWFTDGETASIDADVHRNEKAWAGEIMSIAPETQTIRVKSDHLSSDDVAALVGKIVHFGKNAATANSVISARMEAGELVLGMRDDILIGLVRLLTVTPNRLVTASKLIFASTYSGAGLRTLDGLMVGRIKAAGDDWIETQAPVARDALNEDDDVWITQMSPGDRVRIPSMYAWRH